MEVYIYIYRETNGRGASGGSGTIKYLILNPPQKSDFFLYEFIAKMTWRRPSVFVLAQHKRVRVHSVGFNQKCECTRSVFFL